MAKTFHLKLRQAIGKIALTRFPLESLKMKAKTEIKIGLFPAVVIISFDIYGLLFSTWPLKFLLALFVETILFLVFSYALIRKKLKIGQWVYYNWWTLQVIPLVVAFIYMIYCISAKNYQPALNVLLSCALCVGLPIICFRAGLEGLEKM